MLGKFLGFLKTPFSTKASYATVLATFAKNIGLLFIPASGLTEF